jgi:hypothetical protein
MNECVVITVAMVMLLRYFGPYGIIFVIYVCTTIDYPVILDGQFTSSLMKTKVVADCVKNMKRLLTI